MKFNHTITVILQGLTILGLFVKENVTNPFWSISVSQTCSVFLYLQQTGQQQIDVELQQLADFQLYLAHSIAAMQY